MCVCMCVRCVRIHVCEVCAYTCVCGVCVYACVEPIIRIGLKRKRVHRVEVFLLVHPSEQNVLRSLCGIGVTSSSSSSYPTTTTSQPEHCQRVCQTRRGNTITTIITILSSPSSSSSRKIRVIISFSFLLQPNFRPTVQSLKTNLAKEY